MVKIFIHIANSIIMNGCVLGVLGFTPTHRRLAPFATCIVPSSRSLSLLFEYSFGLRGGAGDAALGTAVKLPVMPRTFSFCNFHRIEMPDAVKRNSDFKDTVVLLTGPRLGSGVECKVNKPTMLSSGPVAFKCNRSKQEA